MNNPPVLDERTLARLAAIRAAQEAITKILDALERELTK
jgi:hypothetical protein